MKWIALTVSIGTLATQTAPAHASVSPRSYAHKLVLARWHSEAQWRAVDAIVTPESTWNPCRHYPSTTDCGYTGSNSCGIPQRNPCPVAWRGRLWQSRWEQVRELVRYIRSRYGSPFGALRFRRAHGWY